ncbi:hypothetical protein ACQY0O_005203 [Thecaphora frezii]
MALRRLVYVGFEHCWPLSLLTLTHLRPGHLGLFPIAMLDPASWHAARRTAASIWQKRSNSALGPSSASRYFRSTCSAAATTHTATATAADATSPSPRPLGRYPLRLSSHFAPTLRADSVAHDVDLTSLALLLRGGYIRQSSSGVYTLLPNGLRIVDKIQRIIHQEMHAIRASHLAMPTLLPSTLWRKTKRFELMGSELYRLRDRKGSEFLLAPTHEEEVTKLVAAEVDSDASLPVRVYQITRKHRDEPRPRMGLLRTREFLMKDLYTFDADLDAAATTYDEVRAAYNRIFGRLFGAQGWKSAEADTGAIGGSRSHEYHIEDAAGEDTLLSCQACAYVANSEKAVSLPDPARMPSEASEVRLQLYGAPAPDAHSQTLVALVVPAHRALNQVKLDKHIDALRRQRTTAAAAAVAPDADQPQLELLYDSAKADHRAAWDWKERPEGPLVRFERLEVLSDFECVGMEPDQVEEAIVDALVGFASPNATGEERAELNLSAFFPHQFAAAQPTTPPTTMVDVRIAEEGDACPSCRTAASLRTTKAIEVGHTFLLGTKYSQALQVGFTPKSPSKPAAAGSSEAAEYLRGGRHKPFQMGCYGIGVSRILGALAQRAQLRFDSLASSRRAVEEGKRPRSGLVWPRSVSPYAGVIVVSDRKGGKEEAALRLYGGIVERARAWNVGIEAAVRRAVVEAGVAPASVAPASSDGAEAQQQQQEDEGAWWEAHDELVVDDRASSLGSKLADADLVGYAVRILVGQGWAKTGEVEVQLLEGDEGWTTYKVAEAALA